MVNKKDNSIKSSESRPKNALKKSPPAKKKIPRNTLQFENLISGFSAALISTPEERLENELNSWLKKFVEFLKVDRCVVNEFMEDGKTVYHLMNYTVPEIDIAPVQNSYRPPVDSINEIKRGVLIKAEKIPEDLPQVFRGGIIEKTNTKSVIFAPLTADNKVIGSLLFACYRKRRRWSDDIIRRIKLISEIIANAILRIHSHKSLLEETERRKSLENRYSTILQNANVGFFISDLEQNILEVNDEYCRMSGYTRDELLLKKIWEIDASLDPDKVGKDGESGETHIRASHIRKDGIIFDVELSGNFFEKEGLVCTFVRDITDLNKAREQLEERLEFEELVSEFSNTLINRKSDDIGGELRLLIKKFVDFFKVDRGVIVEYERSPTTAKILMSYTVEDLKTKTLEESYNISDRLMDEYEKGLIIRAGSLYNEDLPFEIREWAQMEGIKSFVIIPLTSENQVVGNITLASHRDERQWPDEIVARIKLIGEIIANAVMRMRSSKALLEEVERRKIVEDKYSSILKNASVGFFISDLDQKILEVNDEYCRMSGYSHDELLTKKLWEIDAAHDFEKVKKDGEDEERRLKTSHRKKDGTLFDVELNGNFIEGQGIICNFVRDITDLNRAHQQLEERLEFETLISEFSAALINIKPDDIFKELIQWLGKFVEYIGVDRCAVNEYMDDGKTVNVLLQYIVPEVNKVPLEDIYILPEGEMEKLKDGATVRAEKIPEDLPLLLRGGLIEKENTKSLIFVPLSIGKIVIGSLSFLSYREEHKWPDDLVRNIQLIGEIIANAIVRKHSDDRLLEEMERRRVLEEKYSSILKYASVGFMITDINDYSIIDVNDEYCRISGYTHDELLLKNLLEIDFAGDPKKLAKEQESMMDQNGIIHHESSHIKKDGSIFEVAISSRAFEKDGIVCSFIRDVTEINKAQKEQEERLRFEELLSEFSSKLINIKPENIYDELQEWLEHFVALLEVDRSVINEYVNDQKNVHVLMQYTTPDIELPIEDMHGTPEGVIAELEKGLIKVEKIPEDLPQGLREGHVERHKTRSLIIVPLLTGNRVFGNLSFNSYKKDRKWPDDLVRRIKLIGEIVANAILRRRAHESLLRETEQRKLIEERYKLVLENANVGFWISDISRNLIDVNDEYCRLIGYNREELLSMKIRDLEIPMAPLEVARIAEEIETFGATHHEVVHRKKDGSLIELDVSSTMLGNEIYYSFMRDITELNQTKKEREERLEFEGLVSEFSAALMNVELDNIVEELKKWIIKFVQFLEIGRGVINEYDYDSNIMKALVNYTDPSAVDQTFPHDTDLKVPFKVMDGFRKGAMIRAEKIPEDLEDQFKDWIIEKHNTKSLAVVPLISENRITGNLTFASYRKERKWPDDIFSRVKLIGEIIASALLRMRAHKALRQAQEALEERLVFEKIISEFSTALINIKPGDIENELEKWLERFVSLIDADRGAVNEYSEDQQTIKNLIQYSVPEIDSPVPSVRHTPEGEITGLEKGIISAERIPEDLPEMLRGSFIERSNARSLVIVPLYTGNRVFGNLAFSNYRKERKWSDELIRRIKLIGEIVGNTILRLRSHEALLEEMKRREMLEERYSSIIKTANVGFMISDMDANILDVNDAYCEMSGYTHDELINMKIYQLDISKDSQKVDNDKDGIFESGSFHHETCHIRKDGTVMNILVSANLLEKENIVCCFIRDVTELKIAQENLEDRLKFEVLTSEFSAALINLKLDNIDEELTPWIMRFVEFLDVERGIINGYDYDKGRINVISTYTDPDIDVPPTETSDRAPESVMQKLAQGAVIKIEKIPEDLPSIFNEGVIRSHKTKSIIIVPLSAENQIIGNLTFATYTKEHEWSDEFVRRIRMIGEIIANAILRKRSGDALIEEIKSRHLVEEKYTSIIKHASVGFTISDHDQNILDANDEYCRMSGYTYDELTKMKISDIDYSESTEKVDDDIAKTIEGEGGILHHQSRHIRKDGSLFDVDIHSQYSESEGYFFSFVRDITELNEARMELEEKLKFEELTSEFSAALINIEPDKIKNELENWIGRIVDILDVDMGIVNEYINDQKNVLAFLHYIVPGLNLPIDKIRKTQPGFISLLEKGVMKAEKIPEDLPLPLRDGLVEKHNTKSLIVAPLFTGNRVFGNMTFACYKKERKWSDELARRIKLVGEIIGNAILRLRSHETLNQAQKELEERLEFEELVSEFSAALVDINLDSINEELNRWIIKFVHFLDVDRGIINEFQDNKNVINALVTYTNPDVEAPPHPKHHSLPDKVLDSLLNGMVLRAQKIPDDLPQEFREWMIEEHGTRSLVIVPLSAGNQVIGNLTFASYREERKWSDELVRRIKLIGEIIASAIMRKHSSDALIAEMERRRQLEEMYTSIIKNANVGFMISDLEQNIMVVNDEYCRMSGYNREELITMTISDIDYSDDPDKVEKDVAATVEDGAFYHQARHIHKTGKIYDVEVNSKFLEDEDIVFSFVRDVTELNKARKELVERLKFEELVSEFSAALMNVKIADIKKELNVWLETFARFLNVDKFGLGEYEDDYNLYRYIATYLNPELDPQQPPFPSEPVRPYGFTKYLMEGETIILRNLEKESNRFPEPLVQKLKMDGTKSILMFPLVAGDILLGSMLISTINRVSEWPEHLVRELKLVAEIFANALMRDKRDNELDNYRKHLERMVDERTTELKDAQKELVLSEKMATLGRLTATVSHELRNPMGTIRSSVFSVQKRLKGQNEKVTKALDRAERNIKRCDLIIDELLNYSRVQDLRLEPTPLDAWINEVLQETGPPFRISVKKECNSNALVNMDQERFRRCMVNILTNAYQAIQQKGVEEPGYVIIKTRQDNSNIIIEVSDNGVGFDMQNKEKLFEPLYSTKTFGVGLGLPIMMQIIEQHGWNMDITGKAGEGASVIITIPVVQD